MPDKEKVIKGLECCLTLDGCPDECLKCPYVSDMDGKATCMQKMGSDALVLLKEQEAIEPKEKDYVWRCGKCDEYLTSIENHRIRFCLYCGKAVKWE